MAGKISLAQFRQNNGLQDSEDFIEAMHEYSSDAICPTLCDEGCEVECDGHCEHGHPSVMIAAGVI